MKTKLLLTGATLLALFALAACSGITARNEVMLPSMRDLWVDVRTWAQRGGAADPEVAPAIARMDAGLESGDRTAIAAAGWPVLQGAALADIAARVAAPAGDSLKIGPTVAETLRESVRRFDSHVSKMSTR